MAAIPFALAAHSRSGFAEIPLINALVERDPTSQANPVAIIARPGLEDFDNVGTAPIRALFQKQGLLDDASLIVASGEVITLSASGVATTFSGVAIAGSDLVDVDGGLDQDLLTVIRIANGSALYKCAGGVVTQEDFPDVGGAGATSVAFLAGYWFATAAGTDALYYLEPAGTVWNAIQFASAEYAPDKLKGVRTRGDQLVLLGFETTEVWALTGDASNPVAPYGGLKFDYGCRSLAAAVNCAGALIWPDSKCQVRMFEGGEPSIISDNGLSEQIRNCDPVDMRASFFLKDGHPLYVLTLGAAATWIDDLSTQAWSQAKSQDYDFWRAHLFCNLGDTVFAADALSNQIWRVDPDRETDGDDTFTMTFCGLLELKEGSQQVANLILDCQLGASPRSGQGSDPLATLTISRDRVTYGPPKERSLGVTGKRNVSPRWNGLGTLKAPFGGIFRFDISDPVGRRFYGLRYNVPVP